MTKHNCPTNMIWSDKKGRCINPELEAVPENPNDRSKASPNLTFPTHAKRKEVR